jgi:hypothetical protein
MGNHTEWAGICQNNRCFPGKKWAIQTFRDEGLVAITDTEAKNSSRGFRKVRKSEFEEGVEARFKAEVRKKKN